MTNGITLIGTIIIAAIVVFRIFVEEEEKKFTPKGLTTSEDSTDGGVQ